MKEVCFLYLYFGYFIFPILVLSHGIGKGGGHYHNKQKIRESGPLQQHHYEDIGKLASDVE